MEITISKLIDRMIDTGIEFRQIFYVLYGDYPTDNDIKALYGLSLTIPLEAQRRLSLLHAIEVETESK